MGKRATTLDEAIAVAHGLSPLEKVRLMERLASMLESDLAVVAGESAGTLEHSYSAPLTFQQLAGWLEETAPEQPWGDMNEDESAGDYIHRIRRQSAVSLDDPGDPV